MGISWVARGAGGGGPYSDRGGLVHRLLGNAQWPGHGGKSAMLDIIATEGLVGMVGIVGGRYAGYHYYRSDVGLLGGGYAHEVEVSG